MVVLFTAAVVEDVEDHGSHALGSVLLVLVLLLLVLLVSLTEVLVLVEDHCPHDGSVEVAVAGVEEVVLDPHALHVESSLVVELVIATGLLVEVGSNETEVESDRLAHSSADTEVNRAAAAAKVVAFMVLKLRNLFN